MSKAMSRRGRTWALLCFGALVACEPLRSDFQCLANDACVMQGRQGFCEANGYCSYGDPTCDSGRRYSDYSGGVSGSCVVEESCDPTAFQLLAGQLGGSGDVDGVGSAARFDTPNGTVSDGAGNLYIADRFNHTIRKVVLATAAVSTVAGFPGSPGSTDGVGRDARFRNPVGVALDGAGALYVTDYGNHTVRKIKLASGQVSTQAGLAPAHGIDDGIGVDARFFSPSGIVFDGKGALYIADTGNNTIRRLSLNTTVVSTLAGAPLAWGSADGMGAAARFFGPNALALDGTGGLYLTEIGNHLVRKIVLATAEVTTLAGLAGTTGSSDGIASAARFRYPTGISSDGNGQLYVADGLNHTLRKLVAATGEVTTLTGLAGAKGSADGMGAAARFNALASVATDGAGGLYVTDGNHIVRKVVPESGAVTTLVGLAPSSGSSDGIGAAARLNGPGGVASDGAGNFYLADQRNGVIRKLVVATGEVVTVAGAAGVRGTNDGIGTAARFFGPRDLCSDGDGRLYIVDTSNDNVRSLEIATGAVSTVAGLASSPASLDGIGTAARFAEPSGITCDQQGNLFITDTANHTIRKVVLATRAVTTLAGLVSMPTSGSDDGVGTSARFSFPEDIVSDGAGNLYVADTGNHTIRKIVIASAEVTTIAGTAGIPGFADGAAVTLFNTPRALAVSGADLFIADTYNHVLRKLVLSSGLVTTLPCIPREIQLGPGLAVSAPGQLVTTTEAENAVFLVRGR